MQRAPLSDRPEQRGIDEFLRDVSFLERQEEAVKGRENDQ